MGTLYIVSTPIGNLEDITFRAVKTLLSVDVIVCEDTRRMGIFLQHISLSSNGSQIPKRPQLVSYYDENEIQRIPEIIEMLKQDKYVALVSDAGTPAISDPGFKLIRACIQEHILVEAIPGASSVLTALVVSGLPTDKFLFLGYLPHKESHAKKQLEHVKEVTNIIKTTIIIFEAPHKLLKTLKRMKEVLGDCDIVICRELTKIHEEVLRLSIRESIEHFTSKKPKGEFVILM